MGQNRSNKKGKKRQTRWAPSISRDPPAEVKRKLRQEVHYACPIPGCGRPLLEWHHFDPPWNEKRHHDERGMIALCTVCHPKADAGMWTKEQLRTFKSNPPPPGIIRETFAWSERPVVYRLGGNYSTECAGGILAIGGRRVLWEERPSEGRLLFSLDFFGEDGCLLLQIDQNCLSVNAARVADFRANTGGTHFELWLGENKPGIDLRFQRLPLKDLQEQMKQDDQRAEEAVLRQLGDSLAGLDTELVRQSLASRPRGILEHIKTNCIDGSGMITLVNISRARLHSPAGTRIDIFSDGIGEAGKPRTFVGCDSWANSGFGFSL